MKKEFSFYEFVAIIIPGILMMWIIAILLQPYYGCELEFNNLSNLFHSMIYLSCAYVIGHIAQIFGRKLEDILWKYQGGQPTTWILDKTNKYLDQQDQKKIKLKLQQHDINQSNLYQFLIAKQFHTSRIDIFNGNYALFRGLMVTAITVAVVSYLTTSYLILPILFMWFNLCSFINGNLVLLHTT
jgi:hypothetical protein